MSRQLASALALPPVGAMVKLTRDGRKWWRVRAADSRFAILTRQAEFKPKGTVLYTILDIEQGVRGPCNLIGQGWAEKMTDEECRDLLLHLQVGAKVRAWDAGDRSFDVEDAWALTGGHWVEVSHRNRVQLDLGEVRR